ncbi:hypothetical protein HPB52_023672 [Rhipicephalus sanguineus]|uniref:Uncharacterized protein n=1 Tax=Rhipicephalus sanguineus TaxID=34632 RepID=A0A9D4PE66_RHISA|nr:hypothetical protein HPB52_023672 [Rhipicephalus sanguineus]
MVSEPQRPPSVMARVLSQAPGHVHQPRSLTLQQLHHAQQPTANCIDSTIRDEVQHVLGAPRRETPAFIVSSKPRRVTYAEALRHTVPSLLSPPPVSGFLHDSYADTFGHISPAPVPVPAATPYATLLSAQAAPVALNITMVTILVMQQASDAARTISEPSPADLTPATFRGEATDS